MIQFPDLGVAAQPSTFDEPDAPDRQVWFGYSSFILMTQLCFFEKGKKNDHINCSNQTDTHNTTFSFSGGWKFRCSLVFKKQS